MRFLGKATAAAVNVATLNEVVLATVNVSEGGAGPANAWIRANINLLVGAGTTGLIVRIRQGTTIAGPSILTINLSATPGNTVQIPVECGDASGYAQQAGGGNYCVTVTQTAATGNGTANDVRLIVEDAAA